MTDWPSYFCLLRLRVRVAARPSGNLNSHQEPASLCKRARDVATFRAAQRTKMLRKKSLSLVRRALQAADAAPVASFAGKREPHACSGSCTCGFQGFR